MLATQPHNSRKLKVNTCQFVFTLQCILIHNVDYATWILKVLTLDTTVIIKIQLNKLKF